MHVCVCVCVCVCALCCVRACVRACMNLSSGPPFHPPAHSPSPPVRPPARLPVHLSVHASIGPLVRMFMWSAARRAQSCLPAPHSRARGPSVQYSYDTHAPEVLPFNIVMTLTRQRSFRPPCVRACKRAGGHVGVRAGARVGIGGAHKYGQPREGQSPSLEDLVI